ncbi:RebB family R body protein [Chromobacterium phragmitis]|uniref:R body protein RebB-like protein n=1 Tax=Chromobacterium phragmitis TaxID=2202141 RepID=A0A344UHS1_9NEIS|nr:RebB family R body protein [Chromobacterium phragmitis]AXE34819.1 R body protein RebB-like protein [Chromobacterium phragmitis]
MARDTSVNSQITDAVTQVNVKVLAESPAMAMGSMFQALSHSTGILFENAVSAQQQQNTLAQAGSNMGVMQIYSVDTMADAAATEKTSQGGIADNLTSMLTVLQSFQNR